MIVSVYPKNTMTNVTVSLNYVYRCYGLTSASGRIVVPYSGCATLGGDHKQFRLQDAGDIVISLFGYETDRTPRRSIDFRFARDDN